MASKLLVAALFASAAFAASRTTLDGVYTKGQAERGQDAYRRNCAGCHQADLNGTGGTPRAAYQHVHREVARSCTSATVPSHSNVDAAAEPQGHAAGQRYLDIVTYILAANEFPAGAKELTGRISTDPVGRQRRSTSLPPAATVRAVGCLAHAGED